MGVVGLIVAAIGPAFVYQRTRPVLEFYGPEAIAVMRDPDDMVALRLTPTDGTSEIEFGGESFAVVEQRNVFAGRGYTNARDSLIKRETYDWSGTTTSACEPTWTHALRMENEGGKVIVLLSLDCPRTALASGDKTLVLKDRIAEGFRTIFAAQFERDEDDSTPADEGTTGNEAL